MFAPDAGIPEDPATGSASGPLGCYLVKYGLVKDNPARMVSEQGFEMGRPSYIHIEIGQANGEINMVKVGGQCVPVGQGFIEL
jgi:trans-2,3-dihydro-3-hydroxyanthranilate isomerase